MQMSEQKLLSKTDGFITIDIPPIPLPTPMMAARWFMTNPVIRALFFVAMGVGMGHLWYSPSTSPKVHPAPVITVTETLADFAARESQGLTNDEREKLIAVTELILDDHFDTPSAIREEFRFQRLKAGLDSPAFRNFSAKWESRLEEMAIDETVESMRRCYEALLYGLQSVQSYVDVSIESEDVAVSPNTERAKETVQRQRFFRRR